MAPKTPFPGTPFQKTRVRSLIGPCNVAPYYLTNSRRKTGIFSGRITAFLGNIASPEKGGEAKLVKPGMLRARIFLPERQGEKGGVHAGESLSCRAPSPIYLPGPRVHPDLHYLSRGWEGFFPAGGSASLRLRGTRDPDGSFCPDRGIRPPQDRKAIFVRGSGGGVGTGAGGAVADGGGQVQ